MFSLIEIETGMLVEVYGINGQYFLVYDELNKVWGYKHMNGFRPATPVEMFGGI